MRVAVAFGIAFKGSCHGNFYLPDTLTSRSCHILVTLLCRCQTYVFIHIALVGRCRQIVGVYLIESIGFIAPNRSFLLIGNLGCYSLKLPILMISKFDVAPLNRFHRVIEQAALAYILENS